MKKNLKRVLIGVIGFAILGLLWFVFVGSKGPAPEVLTVTSTAFISQVSVSGSVKPSLSADLAFGQAGVITQVNVRAGQKVKAGTVLASLQNEDLKADLLEKIYILDAERANLGVLLEGGSPSSISRNNNNNNNNNDDDEDRERNSERPTIFGIRERQAVINAAEAGVLSAEAALNKTLIVAPFDGVVGRVDAEVGETAVPETSLISLQSTGAFEVETFVPELDIPGIAVGNEASVTLDAYGESVSFPAKVISIDSSETVRNNAPTYKVKLILNKPDARIRSGMTANIMITTEYTPNKIVVPQGAVYERNGNNYVQLQTDERIIENQVVTGRTSALGQVEIVTGLKPGDQLVLNPNNQ